jgi:recombinational DNA repair protein RecR
MSHHEVGECDACGVTTRGEFCRACKDRVDDASKAFTESVAKALTDRDDATAE